MAQITVEGQAGSTEPDSTVIAMGGAEVHDVDGAFAAELARGRAGPDGSFGGQPQDAGALGVSGDRRSIFIVAVDGAGNVSDADGDPANGVQASLVEDAVWRATLLGKVRGSAAENPHELFERQVFSATLEQGDSSAAGWQLAELDPVSPPTTSGAGDWRQLGPAQRLGGVGFGVLAYDLARGQAVLFGAPAADGRSTWLLTGDHWQPAVVVDPQRDGAPEPRDENAMAYDPRRGRVVTFGGSRPPRDDLWEFDGFSWSARQPVDPEMDGDPEARFAHAMVFDGASNKLLLYGGCARRHSIGYCDQRLDDLWAYDGTSWQGLCRNQACDVSAPAPRNGPALAYDPTQRRTLMFGGRVRETCTSPQFAQSCPSNDLYAWDGAVWTALCDASPCADAAPPPRSSAGLVYDPVSRQLILHGGCARTGRALEVGCVERLNDTWSFDGNVWTELVSAPPTQRPLHRSHADGVQPAPPRPAAGAAFHQGQRHMGAPQRPVARASLDELGPPRALWRRGGVRSGQRRDGRLRRLQRRLRKQHL